MEDHGGVLLLSRLTRRTLPEVESPFVFPSRQFWYESSTNTVWWDAEGLWSHFQNWCGMSKVMKRCAWLQQIDEWVSCDLAASPPFSRRASKNCMGSLEKCVLNTRALHTYIFVSVDKCGKDDSANIYKFIFLEIIAKALGGMQTPQDQVIKIDTEHSLHVNVYGQVKGFAEYLESLDGKTRMGVMRYWMKGCYSDIQSPTIPLVDIALFAVSVAFLHPANLFSSFV
jgi:hypothetical protein